LYNTRITDDQLYTDKQTRTIIYKITVSYVQK